MEAFRENRSLGLFLACVALSMVLPPRQGFGQAWREQHPPVSPSARWGAAAAFDSARSRLVVFGGRSDTLGDAVAAETWEWDGVTWTQAFPVASPPARYLAAMVFDSARGRTVLFGGGPRPSAGYFLNDTWEWDGVNWAQVTPATSPPGRYVHAMAYDSLRSRTVLFGGYVGGPLADTWEFDGANWQEQFPAVRPPAPLACALAFDSVRNRTVLFGGTRSIPGVGVSQTWEWDGLVWTRAVLATEPGPREFACLAYAWDQRQAVLFGGTTGLGTQVYGDTWGWDGTQWSEFNGGPHPPGRQYAVMAYDSAHSAAVLFGGWSPQTNQLGDTWTFGNTIVTSVVPPSGSEAGGDLVHIRGSGFWGIRNGDVSFGGTPGTVLSASATDIVLRTPPGTGVVAVQVDTVTVPAAFEYFQSGIAARFGNVNEGIGDRDNVFQLDGSTGDLNRELAVGVGQRLDGYMQVPSSRSDARFALYAWIGVPGVTNVTSLPRGLGSMIFPTPFAGTTPQPRVIFNNIGFRRSLGSPTFASTPAPSQVFIQPRGSPRPVNLAFQGIIQDDGSQILEGYSVTNAVVLHVR